MNTYQLFLTAIRSLNKHKMRSLLTTLGIIVGIVSIISVMSIGEGAKHKIKDKIETLGTNFIVVLAGSPKNAIARKGIGGNLTLKNSDLNAILGECDDIAQASPGIMRTFKSIYENNNWQCLVAGVNEQFLEIRKWSLTKGYSFDKHAVKTNKKIVIIGQTVKKELFGSTNPIGKIIRIKKIPFTVIGILEERGKLPDGRDEDDIIIMPITTMQKKIAGIKTNKFSVIIISAKYKDRMDIAANEIKAILRQQHNLRKTEEDDFSVFTQNDISEASDAASSVLNLLLFIIASISLIVGGIGIMNIMLVTVSERRKEIGIRMAIGATEKIILIQFVLEAIIICISGGILGIILGTIAAKMVGYSLGWPVLVSIKAIIISLSSSILIGLFFGYYPAKKASKLNVVDALIDQ